MDTQQHNWQNAEQQPAPVQPQSTAFQPQQTYAQPQQPVIPTQQANAQPPAAQPQQQFAQPQPVRRFETIFCSTCGQQIAKVARACPFCGAPVYQNLPRETPQPQQIIINNSNNNANVNTVQNGYGPVPAGLRAKSKWVALLLLIFLGGFGAHKFYEGKILMGIVYIFTIGLFGIGWIVDFFALLFKPNPYYV